MLRGGWAVGQEERVVNEGEGIAGGMGGEAELREAEKVLMSMTMHCAGAEVEVRISA